MKKAIALLIGIWMIIPLCVYAASGQFINGSYKKGDRGPEIRVLQQALKIAGTFKEKETTQYFGPTTENALKAFQKSVGLDSDGVLGAGTIKKLTEKRCAPALTAPVYKPNGTYQDLPVLQAALNSEGLYTGTYGTKYDAKTKDAVTAFQKKYQLPADGVAGKGTLKKLASLSLVASANSSNTETKKTAVEKPKNTTIGTLTAKAYKKGDKNPEVIVIQQVLAKEGFLKIDGAFTENYGAQTEAAVKLFQAKYGLQADGVMGKGTIDKMVALKYIKVEVATTAVNRGDKKAEKVTPQKTEKTTAKKTQKSSGKTGIPINWYDIKPSLKAKKTNLLIEDFYSGTTFQVQVSYSATVHADIEPLTAGDTETVRKIWGGFSWDRRPVLVHFNGKVYAASMNGMPHAGLENKPEGVTVSGRSGGFGKGYNFDDIKGNNMDGHLCLHFAGSRTHGGNRLDPQHQACVQIAAGN